MNFRLLLLILFFVSASCYSSDVQFPKTSKVTIIGDALYIQGKEVSIWQIETKQSIEKVTQYYLELWEKTAGRFDISDINQDVIINRAYSGNLYTAQLTKTYSGTIGIISRSKEPSNKLKRIAQKAKKISKPQGTKVLSEIISLDGSKYSTTQVMENYLTINQNLNYYFNYYQKKGWGINQTHANKKMNEGHFLAKNGPSELNLTFKKKQGKTYLTAVRVDAGL